MPLAAIAIDDEPQALDIVRHHAAKIPFLDLKATFTDAFAGIAWLQTNRADLLFLDINMPDISGIDVVNCLPRGILVVFTTAHADYAVRGFDLDAVDYLLKPFSPARFLKACTKAAEIQTTRGGNLPDSLFVKTGYAEEKVLFSEILYVEAEGNYLSWVLTNRKLMSRQTMSEVGAEFPSGQFIRVHRSFYVAVDKITKITRQEITVAGRQIPIGASYEDAIALLRARLV